MASAPEFVSATPAVAIRPMHEADVPAVAEVERSAYAFPWSVGIFRDCLRVGYVCRVVELEGRVIGHGILSMGAGEAHILNLCVQAEYRCLGVGRRLLTLLIDIARGAGMTDAFLEVRPTNTAAIRLYLAMGFEQVGVRRGYYQAVNGREDAAVLRLPIVSD